MNVVEIDSRQLSGRNRRLWHEWQKLEQGLQGRSDIRCRVAKTNAAGLPIRYLVDYCIHSLCGVTNVERLNEQGVDNTPLYANHFLMQIDLPVNYPCVDGAPVLNFLTTDSEGQDIPHPWHPNIRYFGDFAGRVCINMADTYTDLLWGVRRVAAYLRYEIYHATLEPPYPEDLQVAAWVRKNEEKVISEK
jgi:hypothetical protein